MTVHSELCNWPKHHYPHFREHFASAPYSTCHFLWFHRHSIARVDSPPAGHLLNVAAPMFLRVSQTNIALVSVQLWWCKWNSRLRDACRHPGMPMSRSTMLTTRAAARIHKTMAHSAWPLSSKFINTLVGPACSAPSACPSFYLSLALSPTTFAFTSVAFLCSAWKPHPWILLLDIIRSWTILQATLPNR